MVHLHSGPYHILMNSVNFGREVKSLMSSGREFQILGPKVLNLFSPNIAVFALLTCMKSGYKDFKVLKTSTANLRKRLASMVGRSAFNSKLL